MLQNLLIKDNTSIQIKECIESCIIVQHWKCLASGRKINTSFNSVLKETYNVLSAEWEILQENIVDDKKIIDVRSSRSLGCQVPVMKKLHQD